MKALSIRQPWASLIMAGIKPVENRDWSTEFRGQLIIHAGKQVDSLAQQQHGHMLNFDPPRGVLLGVVSMVDCVEEHDSEWFMGRYGFVMRHPMLYPAPVPWIGALGLFNVPDEIAAKAWGSNDDH